MPGLDGQDIWVLGGMANWQGSEALTVPVKNAVDWPSEGTRVCWHGATELQLGHADRVGRTFDLPEAAWAAPSDFRHNQPVMVDLVSLTSIRRSGETGADTCEAPGELAYVQCPTNADLWDFATAHATSNFALDGSAAGDAVADGEAGAEHADLCGPTWVPDVASGGNLWNSDPVACDSDALVSSFLNSEPCTGWSQGSALHAEGRCRPCGFLWSVKGCLQGAGCECCHLHDRDWRKTRRLEKRLTAPTGRRARATDWRGGGRTAKASPARRRAPDAAAQGPCRGLPATEALPEASPPLTLDTLQVFQL